MGNLCMASNAFDAQSSSCMGYHFVPKTEIKDTVHPDTTVQVSLGEEVFTISLRVWRSLSVDASQEMTQDENGVVALEIPEGADATTFVAAFRSIVKVTEVLARLADRFPTTAVAAPGYFNVISPKSKSAAAEKLVLSTFGINSTFALDMINFSAVAAEDRTFLMERFINFGTSEKAFTISEPVLAGLYSGSIASTSAGFGEYMTKKNHRGETAASLTKKIDAAKKVQEDALKAAEEQKKVAIKAHDEMVAAKKKIIAEKHAELAECPHFTEVKNIFENQTYKTEAEIPNTATACVVKSTLAEKDLKALEKTQAKAKADFEKKVAKKEVPAPAATDDVVKAYFAACRAIPVAVFALEAEKKKIDETANKTVAAEKEKITKVEAEIKALPKFSFDADKVFSFKNGADETLRALLFLLDRDNIMGCLAYRFKLVDIETPIAKAAEAFIAALPSMIAPEAVIATINSLLLVVPAVNFTRSKTLVNLLFKATKKSDALALLKLVVQTMTARPDGFYGFSSMSPSDGIASTPAAYPIEGVQTVVESISTLAQDVAHHDALLALVPQQICPRTAAFAKFISNVCVLKTFKRLYTVRELQEFVGRIQFSEEAAVNGEVVDGKYVTSVANFIAAHSEDLKAQADFFAKKVCVVPPAEGEDLPEAILDLCVDSYSADVLEKMAAEAAAAAEVAEVARVSAAAAQH
eukprot:GDKJ01048695.1.p1 GENE.GDKJ01048695.1~~GDKJ01048695.1.p1  ORF type:complete len:696 (+),score=285.63 GDKJ01048695.1:64-2151(+)